MCKQLILLCTFVLFYSCYSNADEKMGKIKMYYSPDSTSFRFQLDTPNDSAAPSSKPTTKRKLFYICTKKNLGSERFKMIFSMVMAAYSNQELIWVGTSDAAGTYGDSSNYWAQNLIGFSINKY